MESPNEAVFLKRLPKYHSIFNAAPMGTNVCHWNCGRPIFLTARMGLIDTCPDQAYLLQKLLPIYAKVQMGDIPVPKLKTVPKEIALAENVPSRTGTICAGKDTAIRNIRIFSAERLFWKCLGWEKKHPWNYKCALITAAEIWLCC